MKQEKLILLFLLCLLSDTLCAKVQTDELCRQSINFNRNWKYMQGDYTGAERTDYDDSSWETIGILIRVGKRWECRIRSVFLILCRKTFIQAMAGTGSLLN